MWAGAQAQSARETATCQNLSQTLLQVQAWNDSGVLRHIDAERMLLYHLLAGEVDSVVPALQLDWRRALGLQLW